MAKKRYRSESLFPDSKVRHFESALKYEAELWGCSPARWLKLQRNEFSQFGGEARNPPNDEVLGGIGYLIWACSLYEEKASRAVFWLECFRANAIVDLPGQAARFQSRLGQLDKLFQDPVVAKVLGNDGVDFLRAVIKRSNKSLAFRDDVVHGHHMGAWGAGVFRAKGKTFKKEYAQFVDVSPTKLKRHGNIVLGAAAGLAIIDHLFDDALNGS